MYAYEFDLDLYPVQDLAIKLRCTLEKLFEDVSAQEKSQFETQICDEIIPATHALNAERVQITKATNIGTDFVPLSLKGVTKEGKVLVELNFV